MNFDLEKLEYDAIEIPKELHTMVNRTIANDRKRRILRRRKAFVKTAVSIAAMLVLTLTVGVNSSYAFARTARKVPVVGPVAEVLTVRKYEKEKAADEEYQRELLAQTIVIEEENEVTEEILPIAEVEELIAIPEVIEEGPMTLERWIAGLSIEKLSQITELYNVEMETLYAETPEKLDTILLAQIPEKETYLYGYHHECSKQGVALRVGDKLQYFGWTYMNDTHELPQLSYVDMNGDGTEELVVLLYNTIVTEVKPQTVVVDETEENSMEEAGTVSGNDVVADSVEEETTTETTEESKQTSENTETVEKTKAAVDTKKAETTEEKETVVESTEKTSTAETEKKTVSAKTDTTESETESEIEKTIETETLDNALTVSGNDVSESKEPDVEADVEEDHEQRQEPKRGELWVVIEQDGKMNATVLMENDFSSQILHQIKADYLEEEYALQLYLQEEPLGDMISLSAKETAESEETVSSNNIEADEADSEEDDADQKVYEKTSLDSCVLYEIGDEVTLYFKLGVWFEDEKEINVDIIPQLKANIVFSGDTFTVTGIELNM